MGNNRAYQSNRQSSGRGSPSWTSSDFRLCWQAHAPICRRVLPSYQKVSANALLALPVATVYCDVFTL